MSLMASVPRFLYNICICLRQKVVKVNVTAQKEHLKIFQAVFVSLILAAVV